MIEVHQTNLNDVCKKIRIEVFVHEQMFPEELQYDAYEGISTHFLANYNGEAIGYCRVFGKDGKGKIGRIAVLPEYRGLGVGRAMLAHVESSSPYKSWFVHSQKSKAGFYSKLGYKISGDEFVEADVLHYKIVK